MDPSMTQEDANSTTDIHGFVDTSSSYLVTTKRKEWTNHAYHRTIEAYQRLDKDAVQCVQMFNPLYPGAGSTPYRRLDGGSEVVFLFFQQLIRFLSPSRNLKTACSQLKKQY